MLISTCLLNSISTNCAFLLKMMEVLSFDSKHLLRKLSWLLRLPYRRSFSLRALRFRSLSRRSSSNRHRSGGGRCWTGASFRSFALCTSRRPSEELDKIGELRSLTEGDGRFRAPFPSPITPAYVKLASIGSSATQEAELGGDLTVLEEADAFRCFQSHVAAMLAEDGKVSDLADVEDLLYCWSNLRAPAFVELVAGFYEQLCSDLFVSGDGDEEGEEQFGAAP